MKYLVRAFALVLVCATTWLGMGGIAAAHALEVDGDIRVLLHIGIVDVPVAGEPDQLNFYVSDLASSFTTDNCLCSFSVEQNSTQLYTAVLKARNEITEVGDYTFPEIGAYTVRMVGQPKQAGQFQPFKLAFTVRVDSKKAPEPIKKRRLPIAWIIGGVVLIIVVPGLLLYYVLYKKRKGKQ